MFKLIKTLVKIIASMFAVATAFNVVAGGVMVGLELKKEKNRTKLPVEVKPDLEYTLMNKKDVNLLGDMAIACATKNNMGEYLIVVDDFFETLPKGIQAVIIAHEEGHIALGHIDTLSELNGLMRTVYITANKVQPIELEADLYAARKTSVVRTISMLKFLKQIPGVNVKELDLRIEALEAHK